MTFALTHTTLTHTTLAHTTLTHTTLAHTTLTHTTLAHTTLAHTHITRRRRASTRPTCTTTSSQSGPAVSRRSLARLGGSPPSPQGTTATTTVTYPTRTTKSSSRTTHFWWRPPATTRCNSTTPATCTFIDVFATITKPSALLYLPDSTPPLLAVGLDDWTAADNLKFYDLSGSLLHSVLLGQGYRVRDLVILDTAHFLVESYLAQSSSLGNPTHKWFKACIPSQTMAAECTQDGTPKMARWSPKRSRPWTIRPPSPISDTKKYPPPLPTS